MLSKEERQLIDDSIDTLVDDGADIVDVIYQLINATAEYQYTDNADIDGGNEIIKYLKLRLEKEL